MKINVFASAFIFLLCFSICGWAKQGMAKNFVSVNTSPDGSTLSVNANKVSAGRLLRELGEKCNVKVVLFGEKLPAQPISIRGRNV